MTRSLVFTVPGIPVAKGRPRATARNGIARMYTPKATATYENLIASAASGALGPEPLFEGPLQMKVVAYMPIPKSKPKWMKEAMLLNKIRPTSRPDATNIGKSAEDGCNTILYADDCQIVDFSVSKRYSDKPRLVIVLKQWSEENER